jgi:hypothetical protein
MDGALSTHIEFYFYASIVTVGAVTLFLLRRRRH